jgi:hypothetical protein
MELLAASSMIAFLTASITISPLAALVCRQAPTSLEQEPKTLPQGYTPAADLTHSQEPHTQQHSAASDPE